MLELMQIIFKMDHYGHGDEIVMDGVLGSSRNDLSFRHFDLELFTGISIILSFWSE